MILPWLIVALIWVNVWRLHRKHQRWKAKLDECHFWQDLCEQGYLDQREAIEREDWREVERMLASNRVSLRRFQQASLELKQF